jgi:hypothetical protein
LSSILKLQGQSVFDTVIPAEAGIYLLFLSALSAVILFFSRPCELGHVSRHCRAFSSCKANLFLTSAHATAIPVILKLLCFLAN